MDDKNKLMKPILSRFSHIYVNNDYKYYDNDYKKHYNNVYSKIKKLIDVSNNEYNYNSDFNSDNLIFIKILSDKLFKTGISADMLIEYIKKNKDELESLADDDQWETIYQDLYTEFDVSPESKKGKDLKQTFDFIF